MPIAQGPVLRNARRLFRTWRKLKYKEWKEDKIGKIINRGRKSKRKSKNDDEEDDRVLPFPPILDIPYPDYEYSRSKKRTKRKKKK